MISISFDYFKWGNSTENYAKLIHRIKRIMKCKEDHSLVIGANLLLDQGMFEHKGIPFLNIVRWLFLNAQIDRVYALYPKSHQFVDILPIKQIFTYLTAKEQFAK